MLSFYLGTYYALLQHLSILNLLLSFHGSGVTFYLLLDRFYLEASTHLIAYNLQHHLFELSLPSPSASFYSHTLTSPLPSTLALRASTSARTTRRCHVRPYVELTTCLQIFILITRQKRHQIGPTAGIKVVALDGAYDLTLIVGDPEGSQTHFQVNSVMLKPASKVWKVMLDGPFAENTMKTLREGMLHDHEHYSFPGTRASLSYGNQ
jgi:hypothetical protein